MTLTEDTKTGRAWAGVLAAYRQPKTSRSLWEIAATAIPLVGFWIVAWLLVQNRQWWGLLLIVPAALFLVRMFMIQHDCGHQAFFKSKTANDWVGRACGVLTLTPYDYWRRTHAVHHGTHGNLDRRELGGIDTLTVAEYQALSPLRRLLYRLYRHPLVMFGIGPAYLFVIQHRIPYGEMRAGWRPWFEIMATNLAIAALFTCSILLGGLGPFLMVHLPVVVLAATVGVWLFYVQHQFEDTHWSRAGDWDLHEAAFQGSSHYDLPGPLKWMTAHIGVHHVHHLNSRIPFYRLPKVLKDNPALAEAKKLTLWESFKCVPLALWDEGSGRLVSFRQATRLAA